MPRLHNDPMAPNLPNNPIPERVEERTPGRPNVQDFLDGVIPEELAERIAKALVEDSESKARAALDYQYRLHIINVRDYGAKGDNSTDDAPAFNAALLAARTITANDPDAWVDVFIPGGHYVTEADLMMMDPGGTTTARISVRGAGRGITVIKPTGAVQGFANPDTVVSIDPDQPDFFHYVDLVFEDFTMDCRGQDTAESGTRKAWQGLGWNNCRWSRIEVIGTPGSSIGTDFMVDCSFEDVRVVDPGSTINNPSWWYDEVQWASSRSGFGIGVGFYPNESITMVNCSVVGGIRVGFFFESYHDTAPIHPTCVVSMTGCRSTGNHIGLATMGAAIKADACIFDDNVITGVYIGPNGNLPSIAGRDCTFANCTFRRNGRAGVTLGSTRSTTDLYPTMTTAGGLTFTACQFEGNGEAGIKADKLNPEPGGVRLVDCNFKANKWGVRFTNGLAPVRDLTVSGCYFDGNDDVGLGLLVPLNAPQILNNRFFNSTGTEDQTTAIMFHPSDAVTLPVIQGNVFRRMAAEIVNADRLDQTYISGNITVSSGDDPDTNTVIYAEDLTGDGSTAATLGPGWSSKNMGDTEADWIRDVALGARVTAAAAGQDNLNYRDAGQENVYVEGRFHRQLDPLANVLGVAIVDNSNHRCVIAGVGGLNEQPDYYSMWLFDTQSSGAQLELLWTSDVPAVEGHTVALARDENSTVTHMFIDGVLVHSEDVTDVGETTLVGVYGRYSTSTSRHILSFRVLSYEPDT